jgi:hypothetical protein
MGVSSSRRERADRHKLRRHPIPSYVRPSTPSAFSANDRSRYDRPLLLLLAFLGYTGFSVYTLTHILHSSPLSSLSEPLGLAFLGISLGGSAILASRGASWKTWTYAAWGVGWWWGAAERGWRYVKSKTEREARESHFIGQIGRWWKVILVGVGSVTILQAMVVRSSLVSLDEYRTEAVLVACVHTSTHLESRIRAHWVGMAVDVSIFALRLECGHRSTIDCLTLDTIVPRNGNISCSGCGERRKSPFDVRDTPLEEPEF